MYATNATCNKCTSDTSIVTAENKRVIRETVMKREGGCIPRRAIGIEQQAASMLIGLRDRLIRNRTQLANAIRGYAAEFALIAAGPVAHRPAKATRRMDSECT